MKRTILCMILLLTGAITITCSAQEVTPLQAFTQRSEQLTHEIMKAYNEQDYADVERCFMAILDEEAKLPENVRKKADLDKAGIYYNLTCAQSIQQKKEAALHSFELAYQNGWHKYRHALSDTDLDNIRDDERFQAVMEKMKEYDYLVILQRAGDYVPTQRPDTLPKFTYQRANDPDLVRVRRYFKLDSVAGKGDEISQMKNILFYIHNKIEHDGQHENPDSKNSIGLAEACKDGSRGLNCRGLAIVLNECYLAMGFKSRFITCMPKEYIDDCHVINAVYSKTLDKWLWLDPTNAAWVTDDKGNMLSIQEVRERLRKELPVMVNEEANWNNRLKRTTDEYLYSYMAKNLYYLKCLNRSEFDAEKDYDPSKQVNLKPVGYTNDRKGGVDVNDDNWFWQSPYRK